MAETKEESRHGASSPADQPATPVQRTAEAKEEHLLDQFLSSLSLRSIILGFQKYLQTFKSVLKNRSRFAETELSADSPDLLGTGISTFLYGVALAFVMYLPLIHKHGLKVEKLHFLLQYMYLQCVLVLLVHLSAKVFRGQGTLRQTAGIYCIWTGISMPVCMFLTYPIFFYMPVDDFVNVGANFNVMKWLLVPFWVHIWNVLAFLAMMWIVIFYVFKWIADVHGISRRRLILALVLIYMPLMMLHNLAVGRYVAIGLRWVSSALQSLL